MNINSFEMPPGIAELCMDFHVWSHGFILTQQIVIQMQGAVMIVGACRVAQCGITVITL